MNTRPLVAAGTVIGIGMGGFVDGIIFHQILQLHSMLSAKLPQDELVNVKTSMVWDGLFHAFTWIAAAVGLAMLWHTAGRKDCPHSGKILWGGLLQGWGIFNFVEGLIDHNILNVHHVVERAGLSIYDCLFLLSGVLMILLGVALVNTGKKEIVFSGDRTV